MYNLSLNASTFLSLNIVALSLLNLKMCGNYASIDRMAQQKMRILFLKSASDELRFPMVHQLALTIMFRVECRMRLDITRR